MGEKESSSADKNSVMESSNPLFIHSSDHPGLLLVSKKLNGDNYATWQRSMVIALTAKNKIGFVDGCIEQPSSTKKSDEHTLWDRCDKMVLSWLLNSVDSDLADSVVYAATAREIWQDFEDRFSQGNAPRIFQIQKMIVSHTQGTMSVSLYYTKLKALWDELASYNLSPTCSCGGMKTYNEQKDRDHIMQFLMSLNDSYNAVRGQILLMNPLPSVRKAYSLVTQEEKQREIGSSTTEHFSIAAAIQNTKSNNFSQNRSRGHDANGNPLHCSYCDRDYHTVETCYKLHGYPPGHKPHRGNRNTLFSTGGNSGSNRISGRNYGGNSSTRQTPTAHQVDANSSSVQQASQLPSTSPSGPMAMSHTSNLESVLSGLTDEQCKQLTAAMVKFSTPSSSENSTAFANAAAMLLLSIHLINLILVLIVVFLSGIQQVRKVTNFMIWITKNSLSVGTSASLKIFFLINLILLLLPLSCHYPKLIFLLPLGLLNPHQCHITNQHPPLMWTHHLPLLLTLPL
ncbi:unnamed protein product [Prunus brigantina]